MVDVPSSSALNTMTPAQGDGRTGVRWWKRRRRLVTLTALVVVFAAVGLFVPTLYPINLVRTAVHCTSTSSRVGNQLPCLVSGSVGKDSSVRSVELAVARGDGSYSWAGAAGVADPQGPARTTADTPIYMASVTKVYIATLVMLLSQQGVLGLDDPVARYLPASLLQGIDVYAGHDYAGEVTVRQLVSMTSGIPDYYEEKGPDGKTGFDLFLADPAKTWTPDETIARARTLKPHFAPGDGLYYSDTNYQLLGKIIEQVTHTALANALQNYLLGPLGLHHTWLIGTPEPQGLAAPAHVFDHQRDITQVRSSQDYWADGGLVATPPDMIAFLRALNDGQIISAGSLRTMQTWHARGGSPTPPFPGSKYGYGLWDLQMSGPTSVVDSFTPTWGATGSTGAFLYYSADRDLYMAGTVNSTSSSPTPLILMGAVMNLFGRK